MALQKIRSGGEGRIDKANYTILYGGKEKQEHHETAFMLDKKLRKNLLQFRRIDGRISYTKRKRLRTNRKSSNGRKKAFYDKLEETCKKIPKHDTLIVVGDFNAKIGRKDFIKDVAGKETIHETTSDNGINLCHLATQTGTYIVRTKFKHKKVHKTTWNIHGKNKGNQIDHILIKTMRDKMINDVRSYRGISVETDHNLVIA
ncbi:hypothetical protein RN001_013155 [Aquatica leii]|uniref:Craniofacial development protein 2-like n=1 Tax=Aquatica leii TaxID=1421715 RepID=A0AAN7SNL9_9COLE|nr:hypothetical protein RN001_013155 [Aquatica leii]